MRRMASMSAGVVTGMVYRVRQADLSSPDSPAIVRNAVTAAPRGRAPPPRHKGARGRCSKRSELVLGREADLLPLDRSCQKHAADSRGQTQLTGVAFRETDLV